MNLNKCYKKSLDFRWQHDASGTILFNVKTKQSYKLNKTAFEIWEKFNGNSIESILKLLERKYPDLEKGKLLSDILNLISFMESKNMIYLREAN